MTTNLLTVFSSDLLTRTIVGDKYEAQLLRQLPFLRTIEYNYTGVGVFTYFAIESGGDQYRIPERRYVLDGVNIQSSELEGGGAVILFITDGAIDCLEVIGYTGTYPTHDLSDYILSIPEA